MSYEHIIVSKLTDTQKDAVIADLIDELKAKDRKIEELRSIATYPEVSREDSAFDCLAVTQVQVFPFREAGCIGHVKGIATVTINDQLLLRGLRIMEGDNGLFVGYPLDPFFKGEDYRSLDVPITRQLREHIENCVLEKYQYELDK